MPEYAPNFLPPQPGELGFVPNFQESINLAMANAVEIEPGSWDAPRPTAGNENRSVFNPHLSELAPLADDDVITFGGSDLSPLESNVVTAANADEYSLLLRQALGLPVDGVGDEALEEYAAQTCESQMERAAAAAAIAPQATISHTLNFFKSAMPDGGWLTSFIPSLFITGTMRKVDAAAIFAVPTPRSDPSASAIESIGRMGYSSPGEVAERYQASRLAAAHDAMQQGFLHGMIIPPDTVESTATWGSGDRPDQNDKIPPGNPSSS